ncbi:MAG: 3-dehydroquinate synthase [bacterium]
MTAASAATSERSINAGTYAVRIDAGSRAHFATAIVAAAPAHRYAVITDENVALHYGTALVESLGAHGGTSLHIIAAGEEHKTRETWARLTDALLAKGCARDTTIVALGGGVVGDLAGFVAATFMRGVAVVQCPTTLLAMIDASVGGKTGVDTPMGKNLVGAFHAPAVVLADVETTRTLSLAHRRAGLAEAIKHGVLADVAYFRALDASCGAILEADTEATRAAVVRSVEIKAEVVCEDPREHGRRKTLNFGHTLGHAIELASGYELLHGECVAIGMVLESRIAERLGIAEPGTTGAVEDLLRKAGLPVRRPEQLESSTILRATRLDKKSRAGAVEYALPTRIGAMAPADGAWALRVDDALVLEVLA